MEEISAKSFEQVLQSALGMIRTSWKTPACIFLQMDDMQKLRVRASDGLNSPLPVNFGFNPGKGIISQFLEKNQVFESGKIPWDDGFEAVVKPLETAKA